MMRTTYYLQRYIVVCAQRWIGFYISPSPKCQQVTTKWKMKGIGAFVICYHLKVQAKSEEKKQARGKERRMLWYGCISRHKIQAGGSNRLLYLILPCI
jgi:hypothetical protein